MAKRKRVNRMRVALLAEMACALVAIIALTVAMGRMQGPPKEQPLQYVEHIVQQGETLWEIAENEAGDTGDREISAIKRDNQLATNYIMPGQRLLVPVRERGSK